MSESDSADDLIALHSDGLTPWTEKGLADALAFVARLDATPRDDWPSLLPGIRLNTGSHLGLYMAKRYPGDPNGLAYVVRFSAATDFLNDHEERLALDGLVGNQHASWSLVKALAELPHPGGTFDYDAVAGRALELKEQDGQG
jgi:hypothetical protein